MKRPRVRLAGDGFDMNDGPQCVADHTRLVSTHRALAAPSVCGAAFFRSVRFGLCRATQGQELGAAAAGVGMGWAVTDGGGESGAVLHPR
jgi:hypothetical protein